jgi:hypothetical protein
MHTQYRRFFLACALRFTYRCTGRVACGGLTCAGKTAFHCFLSGSRHCLRKQAWRVFYAATDRIHRMNAQRLRALHRVRHVLGAWWKTCMEPPAPIPIHRRTGIRRAGLKNSIESDAYVAGVGFALGFCPVDREAASHFPVDRCKQFSQDSPAIHGHAAMHIRVVRFVALRAMTIRPGLEE